MTLTRTIRRRAQRKRAKTRPPRVAMTAWQRRLFEADLEMLARNLAVMDTVNRRYDEPFRIGTPITIRLPRSARIT